MKTIFIVWDQGYFLGAPEIDSAWLTMEDANARLEECSKHDGIQCNKDISAVVLNGPVAGIPATPPPNENQK